MEQFIMGRITEMEPNISYLSRRWSLGDDELAADLAQEARLMLFKQLSKQPNAPRTHLFNWIRRGMWHYKVRGKSVDGLLNQRSRQRVYKILHYSMGVPTVRGSLRPTEAQALANIMQQQIERRIYPKDRQILAMRLDGWPWNDIRKNMHIGILHPRQRLANQGQAFC